MNITEWKEEIKSAAVTAGTYKEHFDRVIETLAGILEKRDQAWEDLSRIGEELSSDGLHRNPIMVMWMDLNKMALTYWKELGLTPVSLQKINDETFKEEKHVSNDLLDMLEESRAKRKK